jgi:hypothetical protein
MPKRKKAAPQIAARTALQHPQLLEVDFPTLESEEKPGFAAPPKSKTRAAGARLKPTARFKAQAPLAERILKTIKKG